MIDRINRAGAEVNVSAPDADDKYSPVGEICIKLLNETRPAVLWQATKFSLLTLGDIL